MADRPRGGGSGGGGGGSYRGGGRGGSRRGHYNDSTHKRKRSDNAQDYDSRSRDDRPRDSRDSRSERPRHNDRDRSRDRDRDRERHRADDRDRVHKPSRGGPRSGLGYNSSDRSRQRDTASPQPPRGPREPNSRFRPSAPASNSERTDPDAAVKQTIDDINMDDMSEDEKIAHIMGFKKFKTTKNTKIPGNEYNYAVRKEKQTQYRQYMNRQGGFNRPLSPGR